jgi:hypothetical protein
MDAEVVETNEARRQEDVADFQAVIDEALAIVETTLQDAKPETKADAVIEDDVVEAEPAAEAEGLTLGEAVTSNGNETGNDTLGDRELIVEVENSESNGRSTEVTGLTGEGETSVKDDVNEEGTAVADSPPAAEVVGQAEAVLDKNAEARIGVHLESQALRVRRWEVRDAPFEGFKSPPGRF